MKRIYKSLLCLVAATTIFSCTDFLDVTTKTSMSAQGYITDYDSAFSCLAVAYAKLGTNSDGLMGYERFMMPTDIRPMWGVYQQFNWDPTDGNIKALWRKLYKFIADVNFAISAVEQNTDIINSTFTESAVESSNFTSYYSAKSGFKPSDMLLGEARCLRAYAYFTLYRYFGGVPIIDFLQGSDVAYVPRASRDELFAFIERDCRYAIDHCADNCSPTGVTAQYSRITRGSAAGLLAKALVFQASYIKRAELVGSQINETVGNVTVESLCNKAVGLCDSLISKKIGNHEMIDFYPAVFTKKSSEMLICFDGEAGSNRGSAYCSNWGIGGCSYYGATGSNSTTLHAMMYDVKTWENNGSGTLADLYTYWGASTGGGGYDGQFGHNIHNEFKAADAFSLTGDTIRRWWNTAKLYITSPVTNSNRNLPAGLWVAEPGGVTLGSDFCVEPGRGSENDYTVTERNIIQGALTGYGWNDTRWYSAHPDMGIYHDDFFRCGCFWRMAKFRRQLPQNIDYTTFDANNVNIDIPILRMAEIYLLKAEAYYYLNQPAKAVAELNKVRERAGNQSTLKDMYTNWGEATYHKVSGAPCAIPTTLTGNALLQEILWERCRELCGEDDCRWLDISRYPYLLAENYESSSQYRDPLHHMLWFEGAGIPGRFSNTNISRCIFPIPQTEFQYFPQMEQNPGY